MAFVQSVINWVLSHWAPLVGLVLVLINEIFAWSPQLKSNSILQFIFSLFNGFQKKIDDQSVLPK